MSIKIKGSTVIDNSENLNIDGSATIGGAVQALKYHSTQAVNADIISWTGGGWRRESTQGGTVIGNDSSFMTHAGDNRGSIWAKLAGAGDVITTETNFVTADGAVKIVTDLQDMDDTHKTWTFAAGGTLTAPGNITTSGNLTIDGDASIGGNVSSGNITSSGSVSSAHYDVTAAAGNGIRFWNGNASYSISMGNESAYHYGVCQNYTIKTSMNDQTPKRGFSWGAAGVAATIAFTTSGLSEFAGAMKVNSTISATGDVIAYLSSDSQLKDNQYNITNPLEKLSKLNGIEFDWNDKQDVHSGHDVGVIAQEVEEVLPEIVTTRDDGYKAVKYEKLVPLLIEAIKEQQLQIDKLTLDITEEN